MFAPPLDYRISKVQKLGQAIRAFVKPGMALHFAYNQARAMAISNELVRVFAGTNPAFTIISAGLVSNQAAMFSQGLIKKLIASFVGENYPTPSPNKIMQHAIDTGAVEIENQSLLVIAQRLAAGAFGLPFALTRSIAGSSLAKNASFALIRDPFGDGGEIGAVSALVPDVTFIHGLAADPQGNILVSPPFGEGEVAAFAASRGVIATVERLVSPEIIRRFAHLAKVPSHRVLSVSVAPLGCHPYGIYSPPGSGVAGYVEDYDFFMDLRKCSRSAEDFARWTEKWILKVDDQDQYIDNLGRDRVLKLRGGATEAAWEMDLQGETIARLSQRDDHDEVDDMVVAAAGLIESKARAHGYGVIAAGVGYANLAAWLAVSRMQLDGVPVELVAEIGLYGFFPRPGEPFIFSNRNISTCKALTTVETVLGLHVSGRHNRCLAIIGAAQIDVCGNINSTYAASGKFLVGSGGANDIASAAAEIIAITQQSKNRLVKELPYTTSCGHNVSTLITDLGVYKKHDGRFVLTGYFAHQGESESEAVARIKSTCDWEIELSDDLKCEAAPARDDLLRIRLYDQRNEFLAAGAPAGKGMNNDQ